jgi:hypothetical protein
MTVSVENHAGLPYEDFRWFIDLLGSHRSIKNAVDWMSSQDPPLAPAGMVTQDEFSHDILVPYRDPLWFVYDST